jgi:hypothetical protein
MLFVHPVYRVGQKKGYRKFPIIPFAIISIIPLIKRILWLEKIKA